MARVIVKNPAVLSGEPVFRGTRVPFKAWTDYLEGEGRNCSTGAIYPNFLLREPSLLPFRTLWVQHWPHLCSNTVTVDGVKV